MKLFRIIIVLVLAGVACPSQAQIATKILGKEQQQFNVDSLIHDFETAPSLEFTRTTISLSVQLLTTNLMSITAM